MFRAIWKDAVLAESDDTVVVEGNHYFPPESLHRQYFRPSPTHTRCFWKGQASYFTIVVDGEENRDAAWYYPDPAPGAEHIRDRVAFWHGVRVEEVHPDPGKDDAAPATVSPWKRLRHILTP